MRLPVFKRIMILACFAIILLALTACSDNQTPTTPTVSEPVIAATPAPVQDVPATQQAYEPATADPEEAIEQDTQGLLTVEQAQNLVQEAFANYEIINHNAEYDFMDGDVLQLFFEVSYSAFSGITDVVWVDTVTGELEIVSGVEFLHGDDWFEDYDPYWMYRIEGLDPFEGEDWVDVGAATGDGDIRLVGTWEQLYTDDPMTIQLHGNGIFELWDVDGNLLDKGNWRTFVTELTQQATMEFWNKADLNNLNAWQSRSGERPHQHASRAVGTYRVDGNTAWTPDPLFMQLSTQASWNQIQWTRTQ